jgi:hypothetical protein
VCTPLVVVTVVRGIDAGSGLCHVPPEKVGSVPRPSM